MSIPALGKAPKGYKEFSTLDPTQSNIMALIGQLFSGQQMGEGSPLGYLQQLLSGSPEAFSKFEAPLKRQFEEQTVPGLAERFSGLGAGAQRSSAFGQALSSAGAGLSENLASLRSGLSMQALQQALGLGQTALGTQTRGLVQQQMPFWKQLLLGLNSAGAKAAGSIAGASFGGF